MQNKQNHPWPAAVLPFLNPGPVNPAFQLVQQLTEPALVLMSFVLSRTGGKIRVFHHCLQYVTMKSRLDLPDGS
jgi:hypothetical protein